jgi:hypothetical protein
VWCVGSVEGGRLGSPANWRAGSPWVLVSFSPALRSMMRPSLASSLSIRCVSRAIPGRADEEVWGQLGVGGTGWSAGGHKRASVSAETETYSFVPRDTTPPDRTYHRQFRGGPHTSHEWSMTWYFIGLLCSPSGDLAFSKRSQCTPSVSALEPGTDEVKGGRNTKKDWVYWYDRSAIERRGMSV